MHWASLVYPSELVGGAESINSGFISFLADAIQERIAIPETHRTVLMCIWLS
jgi:hypothetical protein